MYVNFMFVVTKYSNNHLNSIIFDHKWQIFSRQNDLLQKIKIMDFPLEFISLCIEIFIWTPKTLHYIYTLKFIDINNLVFEKGNGNETKLFQMERYSYWGKVLKRNIKEKYWNSSLNISSSFQINKIFSTSLSLCLQFIFFFSSLFIVIVVVFFISIRQK